MKTSLLATSIAVLGAIQASALVIPLDGFNQPVFSLSIPNSQAGPFTTSGRYTSASAIGGEAEFTLTKKTGATGLPTDTLGLAVGFGQGGINAANPVAYNWTALWDGSGDMTAAGANDFSLGASLLGGINPALANFKFKSAVDLANSASLEIKVYTSATDYFTYNTGFLTGGNVETDYSVAFSDFLSVGTPDWDNVNAIELNGSAAKPSTDWTFSNGNFERFNSPPPVPEVSTAVSAAGFAVVGLGALYVDRRRKQTSAAAV